MHSYPTLSLKKQIGIGQNRVDSMTFLENQLGEMQALSRIEIRPRQHEEKDVENEGRSGDLYESTGQ
jgi:hypothetical protein